MSTNQVVLFCLQWLYNSDDHGKINLDLVQSFEVTGIDERFGYIPTDSTASEDFLPRGYFALAA